MRDCLLILARNTREELDRPSPDVYAIDSAELIETFTAQWTMAEMRDAVQQLSRTRVHPKADRAQLIYTIAEHFEHMVSHRKNMATGQPY